MKTYILFFSIFILFSCQNNSEKIITETLKQNQSLIHNTDNRIGIDFENAKTDLPIGMIKTINKWIIINEKIDSIYIKIYHNTYDSVDIEKINIRNSKKIQSIVLKIISEGTDNDFLIQNILKDIPIFFSKDSSFFEEVKNSNFNNTTKQKLLSNYIKFQKLQLKDYCFAICPTIRCHYNLRKSSIIALADKSILLKGETLTISAGVGEFNSNSYPIFYINNKKVEINSDNIAELKLKTNKTGKFNIPIRIINQNIDGTTTTFNRQIKYEVVNKICE
jgi:hypothetical protein